MAFTTDTKLDPKHFIRDPDYVKSKLVLKDNKLITTEDLEIFIPFRFHVGDMINIGDNITVVGLFPLVINGKYTNCIVNAMIPITPSSLDKVTFNDNKYYRFKFDKNTIVIPDTELLQNDGVIYPLFKEIIAQGNVPWYIDYTDYGNLFSTAKEYANSGLISNPSLFYILVSMQSRSVEDRSIYYRVTIKDKDYVHTNPPVFIPLKSVVYSAGDTVNKLAGSYFKDGVVSALSNPSERVERLESILKA